MRLPPKKVGIRTGCSRAVLSVWSGAVGHDGVRETVRFKIGGFGRFSAWVRLVAKRARPPNPEAVNPSRFIIGAFSSDTNMHCN